MLENPLDKIIGENVRQRRILSGMSQAQLGFGIGVTFQQISKFEAGQNRIAGSQLFELATALSCAVADLYQGCGEHLPPSKILEKADMALMQDYQQLSREMQATVRAMVSGIVHELASKLGRARP